MKQARQNDLTPEVLALSVRRMGDIRPKDSGGVNHHYKMCKEITSEETSKQIFLYSHQNDDYSNDLRKEKGNGITTGLPPGKSFTLIVHKQDCLHTFED
jgi:hypothetical protein